MIITRNSPYTRLINAIPGINGINPGGVANYTLPANLRLHKLNHQITAVNYTGNELVPGSGGAFGTALATVKITGAGNNDLTVNLRTNGFGVPTAIAIAAAGTGYAANDTVSVTDATGAGMVVKINTVGGGGAVTGLSINNLGTNAVATPTAIDPSLVLTGIKVKANSVLMRDALPLYEMMIEQANGQNSQLGEFNLNFTEDWLNYLRANTLYSWDLSGQNNFSVDFNINRSCVNPGIVGNYEFDYERNVRQVNGQTVPYLEPVSHHTTTVNLGAGQSTVNTIPFGPATNGGASAGWPIRRIWMKSSVAGAITALEVDIDGTKYFEGSSAQLIQRYSKLGFQLGQKNYNNSTQTLQNTLGLNPIRYFDLCYIFDEDGRSDYAGYGSTLLVKPTLSQAASIDFVVESLPGAFRT